MRILYGTTHMWTAATARAHEHKFEYACAYGQALRAFFGIALLAGWAVSVLAIWEMPLWATGAAWLVGAVAGVVATRGARRRMDVAYAGYLLESTVARSQAKHINEGFASGEWDIPEAPERFPSVLVVRRTYAEQPGEREEDVEGPLRWLAQHDGVMDLVGRTDPRAPDADAEPT